jgi:hypothetical protein
MEGEDGIGVPTRPIFKAQVLAHAGLLGDGKKVAERIDHHVADEVDGFAGTAFLEEVFDGGVLRDKKILREGVGEDAIDFFGHGAIKAAEAGFDVSDGDAKLDGGEGDGNGGVHIADHQNQIGLVFEEHRFDTLEDFGCLPGMRAGTDLEVDVRGGDAHLAEENVGKSVVVVLAGVYQNGIDFSGMALHFADERGDFGEIGAGADNIDDF